MPLRGSSSSRTATPTSGFTHDRPVVKALHGRFLEEAMEHRARREAHHALRGSASCWVVETCGILLPWLRRSAGDAQVERLQRLERAGLVDDHGPDGTTRRPLRTPPTRTRPCAPPRRCGREYGFRIEHAMNCDVNGVNWPAADAMLDAGRPGLHDGESTGTSGGFPLARPGVFRWRTPSGSDPATSYRRDAVRLRGQARYRGRLVRDARRAGSPSSNERLDESGYPLGVVMFQSIAPFGDNGPCRTPRSCRSSGGGTPRGEGRACASRRCANGGRPWRPTGASCPSSSGRLDRFVELRRAITKARELANHRATRARLRAAELLDALAAFRPAPANPSKRAAEAYHEYHEHTWSGGLVRSAGTLERRRLGAGRAQDGPRGDCPQPSRRMVLRATPSRSSRAGWRGSGPDDLLVVNPLPFAPHGDGPRARAASPTPRGVATDVTRRPALLRPQSSTRSSARRRQGPLERVAPGP